MYQARHHVAPWLFPDELTYTRISQAIAGVGEGPAPGQPHRLPTLYPALVAPAWWLGSAQTAYEVAKYIGSIVMLTVMFPTYALARMLVARPLALCAAVASGIAPALAYAPMLIQEPLAYPYFALCALTGCKAMALRSPAWVASAVLTSLMAPFIRPELFVVPIAVAAAALGYFLIERTRAYGPGRLRPALPALVAAVAGLAGLHVALRHYSLAWRVASDQPLAMLEYGAWALGALTIGLGVLPLVAALVYLVPARRVTTSPAETAFACLFGASLVMFLLYTSAKAAHLSTLTPAVVHERNLIYLTPLVFIGAAAGVQRRSARPWALGAAAVLATCLIVVTPFKLEFDLDSDAAGLSNLQFLHRNLGLGHSAIEAALVVFVVVGVMAIAVRARLQQPRLTTHAALGALIAVTLVWNLGGELAASSASNDASREYRAQIPTPPDWIDRLAGGKAVLYAGRDLAGMTRVYATQFWNSSVRHVWRFDEDQTSDGHGMTPTLTSASGTLTPHVNVEYVVADPGVDIVGRIVGEQFGWRLFRVSPPLRLADQVEGVYSDGWMSTQSSYSRFSSSGRPGRLEITLSRPSWTEGATPTAVGISLGRLAIGKDGRPRMSRQESVERVVVEGGSEVRLTLATPRQPFHVRARANSTFTPKDYGLADERTLSARIEFRFMRAHDSRRTTSSARSIRS